MKVKVFDLDDFLPLSGEMIFIAIRQVVLKIKEKYDNPKLSIVTTKFVKCKIRNTDGVGHKMTIGLLYEGSKVYFLGMGRVVSSLLYDSIVLNITRKKGGIECDISSVPEEINKFQDLILNEMAIVISLPV
ncbi:MAG: hypothetical protein WC839_01665 [Candidatus Paceibacterota bacterium]